MLLSAEHVCLSFGGLKAVNDVSMCVEEGKITGLIGPNGAGKTTFFNLISGVYKPDSGVIRFMDQQISGLKPYQINHLGISRTYQVINLFGNMCALDNVLVGMHPRMKSGYFSALLHTKPERIEEAEAKERAMEWLEFVGLADFALQKANSLSYGDQRKLEIVRGMASNPRILLLDEPAAGMNSKEKRDLDVLLKKIIQRGISILIIEHDMKLMMGVADYIYVLNFGKKLAEGSPAEIQKHPEVITAYLGGDQ